MKRFGVILTGMVLGLCVLGCHRDHTPSEAAEHYYACLIKGDVDGYMHGLANYDSMPMDYRNQLRDMFLQYLDQEQQLREGLVSARAIRDTFIDETHAHVFLQVTFGDSTHEQMTLPLVRTPKGWYMP